MSLLAWIILGALSGIIASALVGEDLGCGCGLNVLVGMIGSLVGGSLVVFLYTKEFDITTAFTKLDLKSLFVSTIGAIIFLLVLKVFKHKQT